MQGLALHGHMKPVTQVKFNREGDLLFSTAKEPKISVWLTKTGERLGTYDGHSAVSGCDVNQTSTMLATTGFDMKTMLWNVETGSQLATIDHEAPARCCGFAHDDSKLMVVTDKKMRQPGKLQLYNLPGSQTFATKFNAVAEFESPEAIMYAEWGPTNDTIYIGSDDGSVSIIDVETMKEKQCIPGLHKEEVRKVHFDPNYLTLVTASKDQTAKLLDSRDLKVIQTYSTDVPVNDVSVSPNGDQIILGGGMEAQDVTTQGGAQKFEVKFYHKVFGNGLGQIRCHFGTINTVQFHPDGRGFASGAVDGFIKLHRFDESYESTPGAKPCWVASA